MLQEKALSLAANPAAKLNQPQRIILVLFAKAKPLLSTQILAEIVQTIPAEKAAAQYAIYCSHNATHKHTFDLADAATAVYNGRRNCLNKALSIVRRKGWSKNVKLDRSNHRGRQFQKEDGRIYHMATKIGRLEAERILNENN